MKSRTRERVMRLLLSAFLNSDFSATELHELSRELLRGSDFLHDFSRMLGAVALRLQEGGGMKWAAMDDEPLSLEDLAYSEVQRLRLPKARVLSIMESINPKAMDWSKFLTKAGATDSNVPMRRLLNRFFTNASASEADQFMHAIGSKTTEDAYLRGIIRR